MEILLELLVDSNRCNITARCSTLPADRTVPNAKTLHVTTETWEFEFRVPYALNPSQPLSSCFKVQDYHRHPEPEHPSHAKAPGLGVWVYHCHTFVWGSSKLKLVFGRTRAEASLLPSVASLTKHSPGLSREFPLKDCNDTILNCLAEGPMYQEKTRHCRSPLCKPD